MGNGDDSSSFGSDAVSVHQYKQLKKENVKLEATVKELRAEIDVLRTELHVRAISKG